MYRSAIYPAVLMPVARFGPKVLNDPWAEPDDFFAPHAGSMNAVFADGSVRPVRSSTALAVLHAIGTRAGGESIGLE